jgi:tripartite-type tricarboxylate transporter receptor subunit TctC
MVSWAKANPGKLVFASAGAGGAVELAWNLLLKDAGITGKIIPYEGGGPSMLAVIGGHADVTMPTSSPALGQIKAGKLIGLAVLTDERDSELPDVPTAKEEGVNVSYPFWKSIFAPKKTPQPVIEKLASAFKKMTEDPSFITTLKGFGSSVNYMGPEKFTKEWIAEFEAHKELGKFLKKK